MGYKTIMVCLNEVGRLPQLLDAARKLASTFEAHISGLYVVPSIEIYGDSAYGGIPVYYDVKNKHFVDHLPKVKQAFEDAMNSDGISYSFQAHEGSTPRIVDGVIDQALAADLVLVSATSTTPKIGVEHDFLQNLIIPVGRPVLILPLNGKTKLEFDDITLAWKNSRESARAVFDALPLLKKSRSTHIICVDEAVPRMLEAGEIATTLARHDIKADIINLVSKGMPTGEAILNAAKDNGSELLVMGAFGHSRLMEFILGGATRHVLQNLDLPVLMSH